MVEASLAAASFFLLRLDAVLEALDCLAQIRTHVTNLLVPKTSATITNTINQCQTLNEPIFLS